MITLFQYHSGPCYLPEILWWFCMVGCISDGQEVEYGAPQGSVRNHLLLNETWESEERRWLQNPCQSWDRMFTWRRTTASSRLRHQWDIHQSVLLCFYQGTPVFLLSPHIPTHTHPVTSQQLPNIPSFTLAYADTHRTIWLNVRQLRDLKWCGGGIVLQKTMMMKITMTASAHSSNNELSPAPFPPTFGCINCMCVYVWAPCVSLRVHLLFCPCVSVCVTQARERYRVVASINQTNSSTCIFIIMVISSKAL